MSPTGTNESGASDRTNAVSRRHVLQLFGIAGVGIAGVGSLEACSPSSPTAESSKSGGNKEFHGAYPYQLPPKGHFNLAAGVTDGIQQQSPYLDLIYPSGGLYYWQDKKWEYMMAESSKLDEAANTYTMKLRSGLTWSDGSPGDRQGRRVDVQPALADAPAVVDVPVRRQGAGRHHRPVHHRHAVDGARALHPPGADPAGLGLRSVGHQGRDDAQGQDEPGQRRRQGS